MEKKVMMNQKEYLKKYLSSGIGDEKRKKKKKLKVGAKSVKVIDDDIDLKNMRPIDDSEIDIFIDAEDAPQIAGIVDERGPVDFTDKRRWKIIANDDDGDLTVTCHDKGSRKPKTVQNGSDNGLSPSRTSKSLKRQSHDMNVIEGKDDDSDLSPPRRKSKKYKTSQNSDSDGSVEADIPVHKMRKKGKRKQNASDSDLSPPRQSKNYDSDLSPPRKSRKQRSQKNIRDMNKSDSDVSPPRRSRKDKFENSKKKHRKGYDSDLSPPRKHKKGSDSDLSPPRKNRKGSDSDLSPPRKHKKGSDSDLSPPRKHRKGSDLDLSPPRKHKHKESRRYKYSDKNSRSGRKNYESDSSPPQRKDREKDRSSGRFRENDRDSNKSKKSRWNSEYEHNAKRHSHIENSHKNEKYEKHTSGKRKLESKRRDIHEEDGEKRMKKTLDGKTAGLQDARALREETEAHKIREAEQFSKLSKEVTGVGQATVVRNSKTGKKRNLEAEAAEEREKQKRQTELDEKYAKWGRGLKQVEDREEKLKDDLYEMSKPLARYADDADLDKRLREQEREGDPMLEYIKQKQIKEGKRKPDLPKYEGSFMPNRFGIKPGHRWDGVDRSNGYEKRWFEAQNAKKARHEEAYKWSTSDM